MTTIFLSSAEFRAHVLNPLVAEFRQNLTSLPAALSAVWAMDAFLSHCSFEYGLIGIDENRREEAFKTEMVAKERSRNKYNVQLLREVSNAGKHGLRRDRKNGTEPIVRSLLVVAAKDFSGWSAYFSGADADGEQVCVDLNLSFDKGKDCWMDSERKEWRGLIFNRVPVLDVIEGCLDEISTQLS